MMLNVLVLIWIAILGVQGASKRAGKSPSQMTPQEKLEALIEAGLPPQILVGTDVDRGDSESLEKVAQQVIKGLTDMGVDATIGFYLNMLSMFTVFCNNLKDGLVVLDFLAHYDHVTHVEVDTITYPDPSEADLLDDDLTDGDAPPTLNLLPDDNGELPVLTSVANARSFPRSKY